MRTGEPLVPMSVEEVEEALHKVQRLDALREY